MEELNNQEPEVNSGSKPKSSKKKFVIIGIVVAVVLVLVIGVGVVLGVTGKVNFTKKAKLMSSITKAKNLAVAPIDAMVDSEPIKLTDNLGDSDLEYTAEIKGHVDSFEVHAKDANFDAKTVDAVKQLINGSKISVDFKVDQKEKAMDGNIGVEVEGLLDKVTGNITYKNNAMALSFPEFSDKKLGVFADTLENSSKYKDLAQVFKAIENMDSSTISDLSKLLTISKKEKDHFKKTYKGVFQKQIKSDKIKSKSDKIDVDGKEKSVTATSIKLDKDDVKDIVEAYIEVFKDDDEGKEILVDKAYGLYELVASSLSGTGASIQKMTKADLRKQLDESTDSFKDSIDKIINFPGEIEITSYSSLFNAYGLDIEYTEDKHMMGIYFVFGKDETSYKVKYEKEEVASGKIVSNKKEQKISFNTKEISGSKISAEFGIEHTSKTESKTYIKGSVDQKGERIGSGEVAATVDVQNNTDSEYSCKADITVNLDMPAYVTLVCGLNVNETIKKADVNIEDINRTNCIDVLSTASQNEVQKYMNEIKPKVEERLKKIQESDLYKIFENLAPSSSTPSMPKYDYNTVTTDNTVTENTTENSNITVDYNNIDFNNIDYNNVDYNAILDYYNSIDMNSVNGLGN